MPSVNVLAFVIHRKKKLKHRPVVMDGVEDEDEVETENNDIDIDECPMKSMKIITTKIKPNKKRSDESETIIKKVKSPSKVKR